MQNNAKKTKNMKNFNTIHCRTSFIFNLLLTCASIGLFIVTLLVWLANKFIKPTKGSTVALKKDIEHHETKFGKREVEKGVDTT